MRCRALSERQGHRQKRADWIVQESASQTSRARHSTSATRRPPRSAKRVDKLANEGRRAQRLDMSILLMYHN